MFLLAVSCILYIGQTLALENLALNKPASQSSFDFGGYAYKANDGDTRMIFGKGTCTHSQREMTPWWTVDLEGNYSVHSLRIYNRDGICKDYYEERCADRLAGFRVHVSDEINTTVPETRFKYLCHTHDDTLPVPAIIDVTCTSLLVGRYVTISVLLTSPAYFTLCEVEVFGPATNHFNPCPRNIPLNSPVDSLCTSHVIRRTDRVSNNAAPVH